MKRLLMGAIVAGGLLAQSLGCIVHEREYAVGRCRGGIWIAGHRGPRGVWHPGHWRCPGVVEVVEVE